MSKRFGRNQKRRLRAALADAARRDSELRMQAIADKRRAATLTREYSELADWVRRALGHSFVGLPPPDVTLDARLARLPDRWRMAAIEWSDGPITAPLAPHDALMHELEAWRVQADVEWRNAALRYAHAYLHVRVAGRTTVGLYMTPEAIAITRPSNTWPCAWLRSCDRGCWS